MSATNRHTRFVSFDAEGTLATHAFTRTFMQEVVPALYARKHGLGLEEATTQVFSEYESIGMQRREWYDIQHWFHWFGLGSPFPVIDEHRSAIEFYPEVSSVLESLSGRYTLVVASSTPLEFLRPLLRDVEHHFLRFFSAMSEWGKLKDEEFFRWLCRELGAEPSEVVHVGDSWEHDFVGSSRAGIVAYHLDRYAAANGSLGSLLDLLPLLE
ncbi:MAG: HAD family hydrolase [Chloroflexi bacterium]|nr:HAD family hydrolase [Chloroflexota bacterium]